jgi:hypothetical protein
VARPRKWISDNVTELTTVAVLAGLIVIAIVVWVSPLRTWITENITSTSPLPDWMAVAALGALVGIGELVARYSDAPFRALLTTSAVFYVVINAAAAVGALFLIRAFGWEFGIGSQPGQSSSDVAVRITQVMVAGLGAMALFRSSLFITRVGDEDVGVGPSVFLSNMLKACDTGVDRARSAVRASRVEEAMKGVSYSKAKKALVEVCARLRLTLSAEERDDLQQKAKTIDDLSMSDHAKALSLGLLIMTKVGPKPLVRAIQALGSEIKEGNKSDNHNTKSSPSIMRDVSLDPDLGVTMPNGQKHEDWLKDDDNEKAMQAGDYKGLTVAETVKKLDALSVQQLEQVREYEKQNKNRKTLIEQIDREMRAKNS